MLHATPGKESGIYIRTVTNTLPPLVLITGPSEGGVGAQTAIFLAAGKPKQIVLAGRTKSKIQPVIDEIKSSNPDVETLFVPLDLADNSSVRAAAKAVSEKIGKLDVLINNAGSKSRSSYFPFLRILSKSDTRNSSHGPEGLPKVQRRH